MKLYKIFIPKKYNDGTIIPLEKTTKILAEVETRFGGYTLDPFGRLPLIGVWNDSKNKVKYVDEVQILELLKIPLILKSGLLRPKNYGGKN